MGKLQFITIVMMAVSMIYLLYTTKDDYDDQLKYSDKQIKFHKAGRGLAILSIILCIAAFVVDLL